MDGSRNVHNHIQMAIMTSMQNSENSIQVELSSTNDEHGLCAAAETHWEIYLIQLLKEKIVPHVYEAVTQEGKKIHYLKKGEVALKAGFTFGAESMLIIRSEDPALQNMLCVEEDSQTFVGRTLSDFNDSLTENGYYDPQTATRWKSVISEFSIKEGVQPAALDVMTLAARALSVQEQKNS